MQVVFAYDINGILEVTAESSSGDRKQTVILNPKLTLSEEELQQELARLNALPTQSEIGEEDQLLFAWGQRLFAELTGPRREEAGYLLQRMQEAAQSGDPIRQAREREDVRRRLEELERWIQWDVLEQPEDEEEDE